MGFLDKLKQRWPGVRARRAMYDRIGRLETRIVELQIQSSRNLQAIDTRLTNQDRDGLVETINDVASRLSALQAQLPLLENRLDEAQSGLHLGLGKVASALDGWVGERDRVADARWSGLEQAIADAVARNARVEDHAQRAFETLAGEQGRTTDAVQETREALEAQTLTLREILAQQLSAIDMKLRTHGAAAEAAEAEMTDRWGRLSGQIEALAATPASGNAEDMARVLAAAETLRGRLAEIETETQGRHKEAIEAVSSLQMAIDSQFASVEHAAGTRHGDLVNRGLSLEVFNERLIQHQNLINGQLARLDERILSNQEWHRDTETFLLGGAAPDAWPEPYGLQTEHPVAIHSDDHRHPRGSANDNTRSPRFVAACERLFERQVSHLDLGCAGGGLVRDFLIRGHRSMGLEGSDFSLLEQRAEWRLLGDRLRTCDITEPFALSDGDSPATFDVISAWEVLEHLPEARLPQFFENVRAHLAPGGVFVASIALFEDADPETGAVWHVTLKEPDWWTQRIRAAGMELIPTPFAPRDYVRGSGNIIDDWDAVTEPHMGFHLVAKLA